MILIISRLLLAVVVCSSTCLICTTAAGENHATGDSLPEKQMVTTETNQVINCYESAKYLVVAKEIQGRSGTDFLIKYKSNPDERLACTYTFNGNYFEIQNGWAEYFAELKNDFLILDSSTCPGPGGLTIWDLAKRKKVFEGMWSDWEESDDETLIYWLETGAANDKNCPELKGWESHGLGGAIEKKVILDLYNFHITKTQETRCSPRQ